MSTTILSQVYNSMKVLTDEIDRDLPITVPLIFLRVAMAGSEGIDHGQMQRELKLSSSSATRGVQTLGKVHYLKEREGLDLVERAFDPQDNRRRILRLTSKGEKLVARVVARRAA